MVLETLRIARGLRLPLVLPIVHIYALTNEAVDISKSCPNPLQCIEYAKSPASSTQA